MARDEEISSVNEDQDSLGHALHQVCERVIEASRHSGCSGLYGDEPPISLGQGLVLRAQADVQEHL